MGAVLRDGLGACRDDVLRWDWIDRDLRESIGCNSDLNVRYINIITRKLVPIKLNDKC